MNYKIGKGHVKGPMRASTGAVLLLVSLPAATERPYWSMAATNATLGRHVSDPPLPARRLSLPQLSTFIISILVESTILHRNIYGSLTVPLLHHQPILN